MKKAIVLGIFCFCYLVSSSTTLAGPLRNEIHRDARNFEGKVGIYALNLKTGRTLGISEHDIFPTASTSKLVVAMATYKYLYPNAPAEKKSWYDEGIRNMMVVSDNEAFAAILAEIDQKKLDVLRRVPRDLGLTRTRIHNSKAFRKYQYHSVTTAYEMAKFLETIYAEKYLGKQKSRLLKNELANTIFRDEIPRFMQTPVIHKIGELDDVLCDVGIIDDGKDQILISIFTRTNRPIDYASDFIAHLSAKLYNELRRK
jgi:beta-lactamase class A